LNVLEDTIVKALERRARTLTGLLLLSAAGLPASLPAQRTLNRVPPPDAPRFMVVTMRTTEKGLGVQAADEIRSRLSQDIPTKQMWVIPKNDIHATLEASGFDPNVAQDAVTYRLLGQNLRADEYLVGTVTKTPAGFRLESQMVLTRDASMVQPLPPAEGARLGQMAAQLSRSLQEARRQLADERRCEMAIAAQKNDSAMVYARSAIAAYPQSTLARVCLAQAMVNSKMPADSVIAVTEQVLAIHPQSRPALQLAARAYMEAKNEQRAIETYTRLVALDPTNTALVEEVVQILGQSGQARAALPIIDTVVKQNPGDPRLLRLQWVLQLAAREWKGAVATGEELIRSDTAAANDSTFYVRLAVAYQQDSQPQKAAEATARGVAKFPQNATLWSTHAQMLRTAGQLQQGLEAAQRALSINPQVEAGYVRLAQIFGDLNMPDSAVAALRRGASNGGDKTTIGQALLVYGNQAYRAANQSKKREDFQRAVDILRVADSLQSTPQSKLLLGISAFYVGDLSMRENQKAKKCDLAQLADEHLTLAQIHLPGGASVSAEAVTQIMTAIQQETPVVEQQKKKFCK
jgi:predicted Zn-dependent protease